jgi:predicted RNase H-like nuclease (RuvC/YqgF family)
MIDWFDSALQAVQSKFGVAAAGALGTAIGFQRLRKMFQSDRKEALHEETQIDVLQLLRGELSRLRLTYDRLEKQFNALHEENMELKRRIRELEDHVCFVKEPTNDDEPNQCSN